MLARITCMMLLASTLTASAVMADDIPKRQSIRVELKAEPDVVLDTAPGGQPQRSSIDVVVTATTVP